MPYVVETEDLIVKEPVMGKRTVYSSIYTNFNKTKIGVNGTARSASKIYFGVSNQARVAKRLYFGVSNQPRMVVCSENCTCDVECTCNQENFCSCDQECTCFAQTVCSCNTVYYCSCDNHSSDGDYCHCTHCTGDCGDSPTVCCQGG